MARYIDADKLERALREDGILPETTVGRDTEFTSAWGIPIVEGNLAHAHWVIGDNSDEDYNICVVICSACGGCAKSWSAAKRWSTAGIYNPSFLEACLHIMAQFKYCPFCGAKMDGDTEKGLLR